MRFAVKDHLGESQPLVAALVEAGHELAADGPTDLFLIDLDPDKEEWGYRGLIDFYRDCGAVVLQYPHGAPASTLQYDNLYEPYEKVDGQLTNGQGEIDFFRSIGIQRPAKAMGWQLCDQFEFRSTTTPRRVVFAPTHVNGDGTIDEGRAKKNGEVFQELLKGPWELVVRYVGDLERVGLWKDDRVFRYVAGTYDMTTVEIDSADCVVAGVGTFPCLSVARGVPAVMYGQFQAAMYGLQGEVPVPLRNLEKYRDVVQYPLDVDLSPEGWKLTEMIRIACQSETIIQDWRKAWIGDPFVPEEFVAMVEAWIPELRAARDLLAV